MNHLIKFFVLALVLVSCKTTQEGLTETSGAKFTQLSNQEKVDLYKKMSEKTNKEYTVRSLANMDEETLFKIIEEDGLAMPCVPYGLSAGVPKDVSADALNPNDNLTKKLGRIFIKALGGTITTITADMVWRGKRFKPHRDYPNNCEHAMGINRIFPSEFVTVKVGLLSHQKVVPSLNPNNDMPFINALTRNPNKPTVVELNYAVTTKDPANIIQSAGVRDLMVAVPGRWGPVWIGRAYTGNWNTDGSYSSDGLMAWFFLDFTEKGREEEEERNCRRVGSPKNKRKSICPSIK